MKNDIEIFFSYAHEDEALKDELIKHLSELQRQKLIRVWHDRNISAGIEWQREIDIHLNTADIILLLISPDFIASDYCNSIEVRQAMRRNEAGTAHVIPIILRSVDWTDAPFGKLQVLPHNGKPVISSYWHTYDEAFENVARGLLGIVRHLLPSNQSLPRKALPEHIMGTNASWKDKTKQVGIDHKVYNQPERLFELHEDWGEAPLITEFFGREQELTQLRQWIVDNHYRVVNIIGIGGVGKTALLAQFVNQVKQHFDFIFWRSLQNAPLIGDWMQSCLQFLFGQRVVPFSYNLDGNYSGRLETCQKVKKQVQ